MTCRSIGSELRRAPATGAAVALVLVLSLLASCGGDSADDVAAAIAAGEAMNQGAQACVAYVKAHGDTLSADCSGVELRQTYLRRRAKLRSPNQAFDEIDATFERLGAEALQVPPRAATAAPSPQAKTRLRIRQ